MVFLAKHIRYDIPPQVADHMASHWRKETPYEPDVIVITELRAYRLEGRSNWFRGNLVKPVA